MITSEGFPPMIGLDKPANKATISTGRRPMGVVSTSVTKRAADRTRQAGEHCDYLDRMAAEGVVPRSLAETARTVWDQVSIVTDYRMPVPAAMAGEGGPIWYTWDKGEHHLEAEMPDGGPVEWFYQNRKTDEVWAADITVTDTFPPPLCTRMFRVALTGSTN